jgi:two-component system sensor histidine kinase KdpD
MFQLRHKKVTEVFGSLLAGVLAPLLITLIDWPFRHVLTPSNILLIYLLGVFFVALRFGLCPSMLSSLTSAAAFAYFFAPPIFSFAIADQENLVGLAVMLVIGTVTSKLAETVREQARIAKLREQRATALYRLSKELAEARMERDIIEIAVQHIHTEFGSKNTLLLANCADELVYPNQPAWPISLRGANLNVARWVFRHDNKAGHGCDFFAEEPVLYWPLKGSTSLIGILALELSDSGRLAQEEQRIFLDTFVNQITHTLERAHLVEQTKEASLKIHAETLRNSLLSSISHDLRTPLATIVGASSTLETDGDRLSDSRRNSLIRTINSEAHRMSDLTSKILEMARLDAGVVTLNRQWYEVEEIIGSALHRMDKALKSRLVDIHMVNSQALVYVDAVLLQQVIVNLLDNALKYSSDDSPIDISVDTSEQGVRIQIADRGIGIIAGYEDKIFDKFFQMHPEGAQSGVGLGLSICRAIIAAHNGDVIASRRPGGGSIFQLWLRFSEHPPAFLLEEHDGAINEKR